MKNLPPNHQLQLAKPLRSLSVSLLALCPLSLPNNTHNIPLVSLSLWVLTTSCLDGPSIFPDSLPLEMYWLRSQLDMEHCQVQDMSFWWGALLQLNATTGISLHHEPCNTVQPKSFLLTLIMSSQNYLHHITFYYKFSPRQLDLFISVLELSTPVNLEDLKSLISLSPETTFSSLSTPLPLSSFLAGKNWKLYFHCH